MVLSEHVARAVASTGEAFGAFPCAGRIPLLSASCVLPPFAIVIPRLLGTRVFALAGSTTGYTCVLLPLARAQLQ